MSSREGIKGTMWLTQRLDRAVTTGLQGWCLVSRPSRGALWGDQGWGSGVKGEGERSNFSAGGALTVAKLRWGSRTSLSLTDP